MSGGLSKGTGTEEAISNATYSVLELACNLLAFSWCLDECSVSVYDLVAMSLSRYLLLDVLVTMSLGTYVLLDVLVMVHTLVSMDNLVLVSKYLSLGAYVLMDALVMVHTLVSMDTLT